MPRAEGTDRESSVDKGYVKYKVSAIVTKFQKGFYAKYDMQIAQKRLNCLINYSKLVIVRSCENSMVNYHITKSALAERFCGICECAQLI
jgi:hypothetical protein